jgi:hypothetical protein
LCTSGRLSVSVATPRGSTAFSTKGSAMSIS